MEIKTLVVGQLQTNCYIVFDRVIGEAIIIDPGDGAEYIESTLSSLDVRPILIMASHGHFDHILGAYELVKAYRIQFYIHEKDTFLVKRMQETARHFLGYDVIEPPPAIDGYLRGGEQIGSNKFSLRIMETPGHTPGSVCFYGEEQNILFSGDTIFSGGAVGRTDFAYGSKSKLIQSVRSILTYPESTFLYPGHGETTTIREEKVKHDSSEA